VDSGTVEDTVEAVGADVAVGPGGAGAGGSGGDVDVGADPSVVGTGWTVDGPGAGDVDSGPVQPSRTTPPATVAVSQRRALIDPD
jgi:hypothetical protein